MLREIITPREPLVTMRFPDELVGKTVEVIAFEIDDTKAPGAINKEQRLQQIEDLTSSSLVDLSGFIFNREEANNYGE